MEKNTGVQTDIQSVITSIMNRMVQVITNPVGFYRSMPKTGGLVEPIIFMIAMGLIAGILRTIISVLGLGLTGSSMMGAASIILMPIFVTIFGFVGAAILFVIWKLMGSGESFEVAFRCGAYATAISPITSLISLVPYIGGVVGLVWMAYLMVVASTEVHNLQAKTAWIVFGAIFVVFSLMSLSSEIAGRRVANKMEKLQKEMGKIGEMTPEEAGRKVGEFLKGLEKGSGKAKQ
jgi:hypothetical protein